MPNFPENYPLEYRTGCVQFYGRNFIVTPDVLIPRLETECLVRKARETIHSLKSCTLIDIGTGSGIIPLSCSDILSIQEIICLDISSEALKVARENAESLQIHVPITFHISNLLESVLNSNIQLSDQPIVITANLPYIKNEDWKNMSVDTRFEPKIALFGGKVHGFELYEQLFLQLLELKKCTLQTITIIIEFGFDQNQIAKDILSQYPWDSEFFSDYSGIERFARVDIK